MKGVLKKFLVFLLIYALTLNGSVLAFAELALGEEEQIQEELDPNNLSNQVLPDQEEEEEDEPEEADQLQEDSEEETPEEIEEEIDEEPQEEVEEEPKEEVEEEIEEEEEEAEEEVEEEVEEEKEGPTSLYREVSGIGIYIQAAQGVLAPGTELSVSALNSQSYRSSIEAYEGEVLDSLLVFDITLIDKDGNIIQPQGFVDVSFKGLDFDGEIEVYYLGPSSMAMMRTLGSFPPQNLDAQIQGDEASFATDHFSIYGIGEIATAEFNFFVGGDKVDSQVVKNGEFLLEPSVPEEEPGKKFLGWFLDGESSAFDFSSPVTVTSSTSSDIEARFSDVYYVQFVHDGKVIGTKEVAPGSTTSDSGIQLVINQSGKAFNHWSESEGGAAFNFSQAINSDKTLYAVLVDKWKVSFNSQGGSQVLPKYVLNGTQLGSLGANPTRAGYNFKEWNSSASGSGTKYTASSIITADTQLYAIWTAKTVNYTLVYWQENANDSGYTYKESVTKSGLTGTAPTVAASDRSNTRFNYFSYKENDASGKTIAGDGSTIVNVYYSRNEYTVSFYLNQSNSKMTINGETYYNSSSANDQYHITAKYDSDISGIWPTASNVPDAGSYKFYGWVSSQTNNTYVSKRMNMTPDLFNSSGGTRVYEGSWETNLTTYTLHYMIESLSSTGEKTFGGKAYNEDMTYSQIANSKSNWDAKDIKGVTNVGKFQDKNYHMYFYYDRNSYTLDFYNPTKLGSESLTVKYGVSISDKNFTPDRPAGVPSSFVFTGWYDNPGGQGAAFNFSGKTMPEHNLALYAKWAPPSHDVVYYLEQNSEDSFETLSAIPHGSKITQSQLTGKIIPDGLSESDFVGWFWFVDDSFVSFDFDLTIERDGIKLYPVWNNQGYILSYDAGGGSGSVPVDGNLYVAGTSARILSPEDLEAPEGKVFIGWKLDGSGDILYPREKLTMVKDELLVAQWGDVEDVTSLSYHGNGGKTSLDEESLSYNMAVNRSHEIIENPFVRSGFHFLQWNTKDDGSGDSYEEGDEVIIDNISSPNELFAIWRKDISIKVIAKSDSKVYDGSPLSNSGYDLEGSLEDGDHLEVVVSGSITNVGSADNLISSLKVMRGSQDVTGLYSVTKEKGSLTVSKRSLIITADSGEKIFDGTPLIVNSYSETGLLPGHTLKDVLVSGSQTSPGSSPNVVSGGRIMAGSQEVSSNYDLNYVFGTLVVKKAELSVEKTASLVDVNGSGRVDLGDRVSYSIIITNTGEVTITNIQVSDPMLGLSQVIPSLAPGDSQTLSQDYNLSQEDIDRGRVDNTASALGKDPYDKEVGAQDSAELDLEKDPSIEIKKSVDKGEASRAGDEISYTLVVKNTGNVTLSNILIEDELLGLEEELDKLDPGEEKAFTKSYTLSQEDIDRGRLLNSATVEAEDPDGEGVEDEDEVTVSFDRSPGLEIKKSVDKQGATKAGDRILYTLVVKNTGNVSLSEVRLVDGLLGLEEELEKLGPGESVTYTSEYTLSQEDIDRGEVFNQAFVSGKDPGGGKVEDGDEVTVSFDRSPGLEIKKSVDLAGASKAGDEIVYTLRVENIGNVTLYNIQVVDELLDFHEEVDELLPGQILYFSENYKLSQEDIDRGLIVNTATAQGEDPDGGKVEDEDKLDTPLDKDAGIELTKSVDKDGATRAGDKVIYSLRVENTGNVTLYDILVLDELLGLHEEIDELAPGSVEIFTRDYVLSQEDLDQGEVVNRASVKAEDPDGEDVEDEDEITTPLEKDPGLEIKKSVDKLGATKAGDKILYTLRVENTGNVTLYDILVLDELLGLHEEIDELAPGSVEIFTGEHILTQEDLNQGEVVNRASVKAEDPDGEDVEDEDEITTPLEKDPGLDIKKTSDASGAKKAGDKILYTLRVENTGNVTLRGVEIKDELLGLYEITDKLEPGEVELFFGEYVLTQEDLDQGLVINRASVKGEDPDGEGVEDEDEITTPLEKDPGLEIKKSVDKLGATKAGDRILYTLVVKNTGNVSLSDIRVVDGLLGLDDEIEELGPGESVTYTSEYTLSQEDMDRGEVFNQAFVSGKDPDGGKVEDEDEVTTLLDRDPDLEIEKSGVFVDANGDERTGLGDRVDYLIKVTNTGNITLHNVRVVDELLGLDEVIASLGAGKSQSFEESYEITQEEIDLGRVYNMASARADELEEPKETHNWVDLERDPSIEIEKTVDLGDASRAGDKILYIIRVKNTGNVSLFNVKVDDDLVGLHEELDKLLPGEEKIFRLDYILKQVELDKGFVVNRATVKAKDPGEEDVEEEVEIETPLERSPSMELEKTGVYVDFSGDGKVNVGDMIDYTIVLRNTGNVSLRDILVRDDLLGFEAIVDELGVGEEWNYFTGYEITQDDLDRGQVVNLILAFSEDIDEPAEDEEITELEKSPGLALEKEGHYVDSSGDGLVGLGDEIHYTITLTNTGNVSLKDLLVEDPLIGLKELIAKLGVGESLSFKGSYRIKEEDLDRGGVTNVVRADSKDLDEPVLAEHEEKLKASRPKLPSTGAAPLNEALLGGFILLGGALVLLRKKRN